MLICFFRSKSKPDEGDLARIAVLDKEIASADAELEGLKKKAGVVEKAIQDLEKKILEIGGSRLLSQKSKVDGIKLHINLAMDEITKAEVNKAKAEKDSVRFAKAIENHTSALQEVDQELEELNAKLKEVNEFVSETQSKVDKAQAAADNAKDDLESLKAELDEKTEQIQKFRQREVGSLTSGIRVHTGSLSSRWRSSNISMMRGRSRRRTRRRSITIAMSMISSSSRKSSKSRQYDNDIRN